MKAVDVKDIIHNNIRFKPARTIIQVLMEGNAILSQSDISKEMSMSAEEATYCIFNDSESQAALSQQEASLKPY